jgi:murein L,D-transpeptidase YcbB/YkuD
MNRFRVRQFLLTSAAIVALTASAAHAEDRIAPPPLSAEEMAVALDPLASVATPAAPAGVANAVAPSTSTPAVVVPGLTAEETAVALGEIKAPAQPVAAPVVEATVAIPAATPAATVAPASEPAASAVKVAAPETRRPLDPTASALYADAVRMAIADRLGDGISGSNADERADAAAISAFYASHTNGPVWTADGYLTPLAEKAIERLAAADADGLPAALYAVPGVDALKGVESETSKIAEIELSLSKAVLAYARHAAGGLVDGNRLSNNIQVKPHAPEPMTVLAEVSTAADPAAVLEGYNPRHPGFLALRTKLAEIRAKAQEAVEAKPELPIIPAGPILRPGMADIRVAALRERLGVTATDAASDTYDETLVEAVRAFQKESRIKVTGLVGPQTVSALNGEGKAEPISDEDEIVANMERWRWLPRDLGAFHIFVNVPEYRMEVRRDGAKVHEARVIVGKPNTQTPIFSERMEFVVVNPSWHVPVSIIRKEFIPKLMQDPTYLSRRGFELTSGGRRIDPSQIDWSQGMPRIAVRQPPGDSNALGHIKFMFPNKFAVYLHDTSSRNLFGSERRAFSHGCVRVDQPFKLAEAVMGAENGWTEESVRKLIGGREQRINLKTQPEVHIAYFTAAVDETGELKRFEDIYGHDRQVLNAQRALY